MARLLAATSFWKANMLQLKHMLGAGGAIQKASENLSDCGTAPYHRFFLVRDEGVVARTRPLVVGVLERTVLDRIAALIPLSSCMAFDSELPTTPLLDSFR
jgi:hypothetical protein